MLFRSLPPATSLSSIVLFLVAVSGLFLSSCTPPEGSGGDIGPDGSEVEEDSGMAEIGVDAEETTPTGGLLQDPTGMFTDRELGIMQYKKYGPLGPPPESVTNEYGDDLEAAHFGQFLFYEERLSGNNEVACATCHLPDHGFADPKKYSEGVGTTGRNAPTLLNVAYNDWYFWDGRADSLWAQQLGPLEHPKEMAGSRVGIAHTIYENEELRSAYEEIFGSMPDLSASARFPEEGRPIPDDPDHPQHQKWTSMSEDDRHEINQVIANITKAIAAFERRLVSRNAPFDTFMRGLQQGDEEKINELSKSQQRGFKLFLKDELICRDCHRGPTFSSPEFRNLGVRNNNEDLGRWAGIPKVKNDTFNAAGPFSDAPEGHPKVKKLEELQRGVRERGAFRNVTLRNVAETAPYMHNGSEETLEDVIDFYAELPGEADVGFREPDLAADFELSDQDKEDLINFMKSLSGEPVPEKLQKQPSSPLPEGDTSG